MRRRDLIAGLAGVAGWPLAVRAQQSALPIIGFLASSSAAAPSGPVEAIHLALKEAGFEVGRNVRIEYRYADYRLERLPELATELVNLPIAVLITSGGPQPTLAARAATNSTPIVFAPVPDPVRSGLVASLNRPGGNITGVAALTLELDPKRLELLNDLAPVGAVGVLLNPVRPDTDIQVEGIKKAGDATGRSLVFAYANTLEHIDAAFASFARQPVVGVLAAADAFFSSHREQVVTLVNRHRWPAIYQWRDFVEIGGLASFGPNLFDSYKQVGVFVARILKGEKPSNLPVVQPTKFELVLNLKTARELGLAIPPTLLARADEVIE